MTVSKVCVLNLLWKYLFIGVEILKNNLNRWLCFSCDACFDTRMISIWNKNWKVVLTHMLMSIVISEKKLITNNFIEKPCSILPKCWYIHCPGTLLDHLNFTPDFKMATLSFFVILNEISWNLMEYSMANSQILWEIIRNNKHWL